MDDGLYDAVGEYLEAFEAAKRWAGTSTFYMPGEKLERRAKAFDRVNRARDAMRMQRDISECRRMKMKVANGS